MLTKQEDATRTAKVIEMLKLDSWEYLGYLARATASDLAACGYGGKTNAEAMFMSYLQIRKRVEKLVQEHERNYPDKE